MRILFVTELWPPHSGSFILEQVKAIAPFVSATVAVLVADPPQLSRYRSRRSSFPENSGAPHSIPNLREEVKVHFLRYRTIPELGRYLNSILAFRALLRFLCQKKERFDLIHAHFAYTVGFAAARVGQKFGIPVVVTVYGSDINFYTRRTLRNFVAAHFTIWGLRHATAVTAVSIELKRKLLTLKVPNERITVIPFGIRSSVFYPRGEKHLLRRQMQLPETGILFLFVGNLVPVKGLEFLLNAFADVCRRLPATTLIIIGSGELEAVLKRRVFALGIDKQVIWPGRKPHEEIPFWMSAADFLVLPSLSEGYPNVILEALACGTPVIASRVGGVPEILVSPDLGIMVPPGDSEALAQAMLAAGEKNWDSQKLVDYAHANTWDECAQRYLKLYHRLLEQSAKL
ncbi:MAG: glycosyltransferase family 4 protein [candidate division KSB1 bacterium]|nr:glycosyltransferase family 4 protein [candidate division KSB1 bacterium]MDZ7300838.1 glycosyltransferase family 4 protein [candidate division KSB1 bacterium]MDZ7309891.1 glycosyltransferase family 4 protein [candidate division KSB1 bacterium]